jgi:uncharacterized protein (UPF0332 family)
MGWFNREFVKTGIVSAYAGAFAHNAYDKRSLGDYDDYVNFSLDEVMPMLEQAEDFMREILFLINDDSEKLSSQNTSNTPFE